MSPRLTMFLGALSVLSACVGLPIGVQGPGGTAPVAMTTGPTAAGLGSPFGGVTAENCAAMRAMATTALAMTPDLDAQFRANGC